MEQVRNSQLVSGEVSLLGEDRLVSQESLRQGCLVLLYDLGVGGAAESGMYQLGSLCSLVPYTTQDERAKRRGRG